MRGCFDLLLAFLDECFQISRPIGAGGLSTKAYRERRQYRAFPAPVVSEDKVDERSNRDLEKGMAHEVFTSHRFDNTVIRWLVLPALPLSLLFAELGRLIFFQILICTGVGVIVIVIVVEVVVFVRKPRFLSLMDISGNLLRRVFGAYCVLS